jgi:hypothetical protein
MRSDNKICKKMVSIVRLNMMLHVFPSMANNCANCYYYDLVRFD